MTGPFVILTEAQKARIKTLTKEGLSSSIIAERLNLHRPQVYAYQVRAGLRELRKRKKKIEGEQ